MVANYKCLFFRLIKNVYIFVDVNIKLKIYLVFRSSGVEGAGPPNIEGATPAPTHSPDMDDASCKRQATR